MPIVTCFGEILWDRFPTHKIIGGAPLNVGLRLHFLGCKSFVISSVGNDKNGRDLLTYLEGQNIDISLIQISEKYPTGEVLIKLDMHNTASYTISESSAWDFIELSERCVKQVKDSDAFIFGSLATRNKLTRSTLEQLLSHSKFKVFDVNLRPPYYDISAITTLMKKSDFIKFNHEEFLEICEFLEIQEDGYSRMLQKLATHTKTKHLCLTLGKNGALFLSNDMMFTNKGYPVKVNDSVGAGDSFLATLIHNILLGTDPQKALDIACATGALVASKSGANPIITDEEINLIMKK